MLQLQVQVDGRLLLAPLRGGERLRTAAPTITHHEHALAVQLLLELVLDDVVVDTQLLRVQALLYQLLLDLGQLFPELLDRVLRDIGVHVFLLLGARDLAVLLGHGLLHVLLLRAGLRVGCPLRLRDRRLPRLQLGLALLVLVLECTLDAAFASGLMGHDVWDDRLGLLLAVLLHELLQALSYLVDAGFGLGHNHDRRLRLRRWLPELG